MVRKTRNPPLVLSNTEIVALAVLLAGGRLSTVDTEDVAIEAHKLAPNRFSWKKHKAQVNLDAVRKRLWDAKNEAGLVTGSEAAGWMLTQRGIEFAELQSKQKVEGKFSGTPHNEREARWLRSEKARMMATNAFARFKLGEVKKVTHQEAERFFRIDEYVTGVARHQKLDRLRNAFVHDADLSAAVSAIAKLVRMDNANAQ